MRAIPAVDADELHLVAFVVAVSRPEGRRVFRRVLRQREQRAKAFLILVVVFLDHDRAVGQLRLKVITAGSAAVFKGADDRCPVGAVGMDTPDAPHDRIVNALRFERAEQNASVSHDHGMQSAGDVDVAHLLDVGSVIVHHKQLQRVPRIAAGRHMRVAVAGEHHPATGNRAGPKVVDAVIQRRLAVLACSKIVRPGCGSGVGCKCLVGQTHCAARRDVHLPDVRAGVLFIDELCVKHGLAVERDVRVHY